MTEVNFSELRRASRISALLTGIASLMVLVSLYSSFRQTTHAKHELAVVEREILEKTAEKERLEKEVFQLSTQKQAYTTALNDVVSTNPQAAKTLTRSAEFSASLAQSIPRVFVHARDAKAIQVAQQIAQELRSKGFVVPAPDTLSNSSDASKAEVVFFGRNGATDADLQGIQNSLFANGVAPESFVVQQDINNKHPSRTYAIYIPASVPANPAIQATSTEVKSLSNRVLAAKAEDLAEILSRRVRACYQLLDAEGGQRRAITDYNGNYNRDLSPEQLKRGQKWVEVSDAAVRAYVDQTRTIYASQVALYVSEIRTRLHNSSIPSIDPLNMEPKDPKDCNYPLSLASQLRKVASPLASR